MTSERFLRLAKLIFAGCLLVAAAGCNQSAEGVRSASSEPHGHHGGHAVELPHDAGVQMEFTLDEERRRMVIYVQESATHKPHPLAVGTLDAKFKADGQNFDAKFAADPRPNDPQGSSSRFAFSVDKLPQQLLASNQFQLEISYSADGRTSAVTILHNNDHTHDYRHD